MAGKVTMKPSKFTLVNEKAKEYGDSLEHDALKI